MAQRRTGSAAPTALRYGIAVLALTLVVLIAATVGPLVLEERTASTPPQQLPMDIPPPPLLELPDTAPGWDIDLSWMWWALAALAVLIVLAVLRRLARLFHRRVRLSGEVRVALLAVLTPANVGLADAGAEVDLADGRLFDAVRSADDIIASWTALERAAALIGQPRAASATPTEFLAELAVAVSDTGELPTASAELRTASATLLDAYHRARFDTAALAPGMATAARDAARAWVRACAEKRPIDPADAAAVGQAGAVGQTSGAGR